MIIEMNRIQMERYVYRAQYVYAPKSQWNDSGHLLSNEKKMSIIKYLVTVRLLKGT